MKTILTAQTERWPLREPFAIALRTYDFADVVTVRLERDGQVGRGEAAGVGYMGETPQSILDQIESVRQMLEAGASRQDLLKLMPRGGARNAIDCALWTLDARLAGSSAWSMARLPAVPVVTCVTIGIRTLDEYERRARELQSNPWLKIKVASQGVVQAVEAVRRGAPDANLLVDANQSWNLATLREIAPALKDLGVRLIEQPLPVGADQELQHIRSPVPLCADESVNDLADLDRLAELYQCVNIKLDKVGGLTAALELADRAQSRGLDLMVGCMLGTSLAMAPAALLAQRCQVADLDGPLLLARDCDNGIRYEHGLMAQPSPLLWG